MTAVLSWYCVVQALGQSAFLLMAPSCRRLPDAGYAWSKCLGVFLCGFLLWVGTTLGVLRNEFGGAALVLASLVIAALVRRARARRSTPMRFAPPLRVIVATEVLFLAAFGGWCLVRFADPAISHTEQPMDLMLLAATATSPTFPPADPWLAGYPVSYYYLGYWLMSTVGHLAGTPVAVSYNLGQACWFGLLITTCFGVGYNAVAVAGPAYNVTPRSTMAAGGLSAVAVALVGNVSLPIEWIRGVLDRAQAPAFDHFWWWRTSRVVQDTDLTGRPIEVITEFPFFSYLLGDNHPHVLAMPFLALTIGLGLALFVAAIDRKRDTARVSDDAASLARGRPPLLLAMAAIVVVALVAINTWDMPAALLGLLLILAVSPRMASPGFIRYTVRDLGLTLLVAVVLVLPYLFTAQSQLRGVLPTLFHPTALSQVAIAFGSLAPGVALLLWLAWTTHAPGAGRVARDVVGGTVMCAGWLLAGAYWAARTVAGTEWLQRVAANIDEPLWRAAERWLAGGMVLVILVLCTAVAVSLLRGFVREDAAASAPAVTFGLLLTIVGMVLVLVPELVYIHDVFENRMNTVFKFYYQAWLFLGVAGSIGIALAWVKGGRARAGAFVAIAGLATGLLYAPVALSAKVRESRSQAGTFDGLDFLRRGHPDRYAAIEWVRRNTLPGSVIAQAPGASYDVLDSIISTATARPTLLGWQGHELQWRGASFGVMTAGRLDALTGIYNPRSPEQLQQVLSEWNVVYVHVGPTERARYAMTAEHDATLGSVMELVFEQGTVRIYRRRG